MNVSSSLSSRVSKAIRWIARVLSALIILFWGFMIVAHVVGGSNSQGSPLTINDNLKLILMVIYLIGLVIAWKWEVAGATVVLVAFAGNAILGIDIFSFPLILVPITACLFLLSWWLRRPRTPVESPSIEENS